jgi:hypothetical protein
LQHWPHEKIEMKMFTLINVLLFAIVCVASVPTDYKCGYLPRELTLKRGGRQKLIFWNDRVYDQPPLNEDNLETIKDEFLEAVNKPGDVDSNVEIIETTTEVFEENEQSETTTNISNDKDIENVEIAEVLEEFGDNIEPTQDTTEAIHQEDSTTTLEEDLFEGDSLEMDLFETETPVEEEIDSDEPDTTEKNENDSEHKHDNSNHDETSEFLDNSDTIEFEDDITTTISPEKETTTDLDLEEIAFDDSEAYFQEDFGTPVSDQGQAIFDPLDDIADVNKVDEVLHPDVEYLETKDPPLIELLEDDTPAIELFEDEKAELDITTTVISQDFERVFDYTTIAYPVGEDAKSTTMKPTFEAVEVELEADESRPNRPVSADTVSQAGEPGTSNDQEGLFDMNHENEEKVPVFQAVEAEVETDESRPNQPVKHRHFFLVLVIHVKKPFLVVGGAWFSCLRDSVC